MRRIVTIIIVLSMALLLCACGHQHTWVEATCIAPKTCSECGATEGSPLGHVSGEWEIVTEATLLNEGKEYLICERCGEIIDENIINKKTIEFINGEFNFTKEEFIKYYKPIFDEMLGSKLTLDDSFSKDQDPFGGYACYFSHYGELVDFISFVENRSGNIKKVGVWGEKDTFYLAVFTFEIICGDEPGTNSDEIINGINKKGTYTYKGLTMTKTDIGSGYELYSIEG